MATLNRDSSVKRKCRFRGEETPRLFQQIGYLKLKSCLSGIVAKPCLAHTHVTRQLSESVWNQWGARGTRAPQGSWVSTLSVFGGRRSSRVSFLLPPLPSSLALIDGNTCWGAFPDNLPKHWKKGCGSARSIFEKKAVNVKPVLIYSGEL